MRAVVIGANGGPEVLEPRELPEPEPGEGQLLVALEAAGVNFRDVYERRGGYGTPPPLVGGAEGAGTVVAVGAGVTEFVPGDRVAWTSATGSYAERVLVSAERAVEVPEAVGAERRGGRAPAGDDGPLPGHLDVSDPPARRRARARRGRRRRAAADADREAARRARHRHRIDRRRSARSRASTAPTR